MKIADIILTMFSITFLSDSFIGFLPAYVSLPVGMFLNAYFLFRFQHLITSRLFGSFSNKTTVRLVITVWAFMFVLAEFPYKTPIDVFNVITDFLRNIAFFNYLYAFSIACFFPLGNILWKNSDFMNWSGPIPAFFSRIQLLDFSWEKEKERIVKKRSYRLLYMTAAGLVFSVLIAIFGMYLLFLQSFIGFLTVLSAIWLVHVSWNIIRLRLKKKPLNKNSVDLDAEKTTLIIFPRQFSAKTLFGWFIIFVNVMSLATITSFLTALFAAASTGILDTATFFTMLILATYLLLPSAAYQLLFLTRIGRRLSYFVTFWQLKNVKHSGNYYNRIVKNNHAKLPRGGIIGFCLAWLHFCLGSPSEGGLDWFILFKTIFTWVWPAIYILLILLSLRKKTGKALVERLDRDNYWIPITLISQFAFLDWLLFTSGTEVTTHIEIWIFVFFMVSFFYFDDYSLKIRRRFKGSMKAILIVAFFPIILSPILLTEYWAGWLLVATICAVFIVAVVISETKDKLRSRTKPDTGEV